MTFNRSVTLLLLAALSTSQFGCGGGNGAKRGNGSQDVQDVELGVTVASAVVGAAARMQAGNPAQGGTPGLLTPVDSTSATGLAPEGPPASFGPAAPSGTPSVGTAPTDRGPQAPAAGPIAGGLLNMPLIAQRTGGGTYPGSYCGPTSVRMVLAYYGIEAGADEVALTDFGSGPMYTPGQGSSHEGMAAALRHYGLQTNMRSDKSLATLQNATSQGRPCIVNLAGNYGPFYTRGHIVVVVGFSDSGDVIINDPAGGVQRQIPARTFMSCWRGLSIEVWK